jgi:hypothetical protein
MLEGTTFMFFHFPVDTVVKASKVWQGKRFELISRVGFPLFFRRVETSLGSAPTIPISLKSSQSSCTKVWFILLFDLQSSVC